MSDKVTVQSFKARKRANKPIVGVTAVDFIGASLLDEVGVDFILVGDSLAMTFQGKSSTIGCRLQDILYHTRIVASAVDRALVVSDMPVFSYHKSTSDAVSNAALLIQEGAAGAVKIEGGQEFVPVVKALIRANVPVMGHLGIRPQSELLTGGYKLPVKTVQDSAKLFRDARALEDAGAFAVVLECVPWKVAKLITEKLSIPTIGVGSGVYTDGQGLVHTDILGLRSGLGRYPKFAKQYADLTTAMLTAFRDFVQDVTMRSFPGAEHQYEISSELEPIINSLRLGSNGNGRRHSQGKKGPGRPAVDRLSENDGNDPEMKGECACSRFHIASSVQD